MEKSWVVGLEPVSDGSVLPRGARRLRLARLMLLKFPYPDLVQESLADIFRFENVRGDRFDSPDDLLREVVRTEPPWVVILGRKTAVLLGLGRLLWYETRMVASSMFVVVPHPSGKCRAYNFRRHREVVGWLLYNLMCRHLVSAGKLEYSPTKVTPHFHRRRRAEASASFSWPRYCQGGGDFVKTSPRGTSPHQGARGGWA